MSIFATPDFGAGAAIGGMWCFCWLVVIGITLGCGLVGLMRVQYPASRRSGILLLVLSVALPGGFYAAPLLAFRVNYGSYPIGNFHRERLPKGTSAAEVEAILGRPHRTELESDGGTMWGYYGDSLGINWYHIYFGADGRVTHTSEY
jgi:hypothetical protein